jgi:hypothetical protein
MVDLAKQKVGELSGLRVGSLNRSECREATIANAYTSNIEYIYAVLLGAAPYCDSVPTYHHLIIKANHPAVDVFSCAAGYFIRAQPWRVLPKQLGPHLLV